MYEELMNMVQSQYNEGSEDDEDGTESTSQVSRPSAGQKKAAQDRKKQPAASKSPSAPE